MTETSCLLEPIAQKTLEVRPGQQKRCNLCGSLETRVILSAEKRVHAPQHWVIYRCCKRCSFITLDCDYEVWLSTYEDAVSDKDVEYFKDYADQEAQETWSVIQDLGKRHPDIRQGNHRVMADIGAGAGGSLRVYRKLGWRVSGIERGKPQVQHARQVQSLDVRQEPYQETSYPPASLDLIHCYHTLEHLPRPYETLGHFYRQLKPGGRLYLEVPNTLDTSIYQLGFGHLSMFSPRTLIQSLRRLGFEILDRLDRSHAPTYGMGFFCQKKVDVDLQGERLTDPYLPIDPTWQRESWWLLRWKLWYAFHLGRGREALTWMAPLRGAQAALKGVLQWKR